MTMSSIHQKKNGKLNNINHDSEENTIPVDNPAILNNETTTLSTITAPNNFTNLLPQKRTHQSINKQVDNTPCFKDLGH